MKKKTSKYISIAIALLFGIAFVIRFSGPQLLKMYISAGGNNCRNIPILCIQPQGQIIYPLANKEYINSLTLYESSKIVMDVPKDFTVVQEKIKKVYYKKQKHKESGPVMYLLLKPRDFFVHLFPGLRKQGVNDDYEFIRRIMYADLNSVRNLTDAFFVVMKGMFTPDLGNQKTVKMAQFEITGKLGFINYNLVGPDHYFDCNIIASDTGFLKIYIKDKGAKLDLDKVMAIISTVTAVNSLDIPAKMR